ncbi:thioredoxin domain-containing protein [uncultured Desulfovibrio sp.]|uniref:DsbA family protein n=1 Tax=uncultured Desulfovibrio sp. TaxID=167968 RepID=UPI0025FDFEB5|nr:thioredoxin domain-containing protein [uncultured Desulfovibrio sp.]
MKRPFPFLGALVVSAALSVPQVSVAHAAAQGQDAALAAALETLLRERPELVLDVLRRNSEAVLDIAQQGANSRRKHNLELQWRKDMKAPKSVRLENRPVLGRSDAPVRIVAFSDFTCSYCEQASKTVEALRKTYGDDICLIFKHLPLEEKGPGGIASAYFVAIALQDASKAWEFYESMFANRDRLLAEGEPFIKERAQQLGVDMKRLARDARSKKVTDILAEDQKDAQKLGVEGTPYFLVNDLVVRGALPLELFRAAVEMARDGARSARP